MSVPGAYICSACWDHVSVRGRGEIQALLRDGIMVVIGQGTQEYLNPALTLPPLCVLKGVHVHKSMAKESRVTFFKWHIVSKPQFSTLFSRPQWGLGLKESGTQNQSRMNNLAFPLKQNQIPEFGNSNENKSSQLPAPEGMNPERCFLIISDYL